MKVNGIKIREFLLAKRMNHLDISKKIGYGSRSTLGVILSKKETSMSEEVAKNLAEELECNVSDFSINTNISEEKREVLTLPLATIIANNKASSIEAEEYKPKPIKQDGLSLAIDDALLIVRLLKMSDSQKEKVLKIIEILEG